MYIFITLFLALLTGGLNLKSIDIPRMQ